MVSFGVVIPTQGRSTLVRTLRSIADAGVEDQDQVWVGVDGPQYYNLVCGLVSDALPLPFTPRVVEFEERGDWGNSVRNGLLGLGGHRGAGITATHITYMDDDDAYAPSALKTMRAAIEENPLSPHMFRFVAQGGATVWLEEGVVRVGWVGGHGFVPPYDPARLAPWGNRYEGDFDHIEGSLAMLPDPVWRPEVIAVCRPSR